MNIEKIKIKDNCYVWVDKDADVENVCYYYNSFDKEIRKGSRLHQKYHYKIIAASPELELEGVPDYDLAFIQGYRVVKQEKEMFTEDDLIKVFHCGRLYQGREGDTTLEQIIERIKSEKK